MDPHDLSNLSEVESLSDSDWLDISSRASEDDSLAGSDSDREDLSSECRSPSRQSLSSFAGSHDGEAQGWEGIVDDDAPATFSPPETNAAYAQQTLRLSHHQSLSFRMAALSEAAVAQHNFEDPEEEQRVKDGLDQSMMSTLSASRSNSLNASVQTSIVHSRDLRLSFPDPLTSSSPRAHSLTPSYEDISAPTDVDPFASGADAQAPAEPVVKEEQAPPAVDPGSSPMPVVARGAAGACAEASSSVAIDFYIVLYGTSSANKYRIAHRLLEKLMAATQCGFSSLPQIDAPRDIRALLRRSRAAHCIISIIDRTQSALSGKEPSPSITLDRPSLAIIFLPSPNVFIPDHTLYLPILAQDEIEGDDDASIPTDHLLEAEHQWESMDVPESRVVSSAFAWSNSAVIEEEEIERASPVKVARLFRPLLPWTEQWASYHLASRHAFTLFAILSIVLGYLVNGSLPLSGTRRPSPTVDLARPAPAPAVANASFSTPVSTPTGMALISSSLKDLALAAISPYAIASTSSSVATKAIPSPTAAAPIKKAEEKGAPSECSCGCGLITWPEKFKPTTDLVLRPTPPSPALSGQAFHKGEPLTVLAPATAGRDKGKARAVEDDSLYALSTRLAGALTEYLDVRTMFGQTGRDVQELLDALDELARAVERQADMAWTRSKSTLEVVREGIRTRHSRARSRAKELREVGERLFSSVGARVRGRVAAAKENARVVRENVRVRREESFRVRRQERRQGMRRARRVVPAE